MGPRLRIALASMGVALFVVLGLGSAAAQRAVPRSPAPQGRHAVPRPVPARPLPGGHYYYRGPNVYRPYYASPYYWYGGYYSYPFNFSVGVGPYAPYYYGYPYYPWYPYDPVASLRLQVTPREAEVFIDASYAGTVDDFDGSFQRLRLYPGEHTVEIFLPGHRLLTEKIYLQPGKTFTMRVALEPLAPGEPMSVRPSGEVGAQSRAQQAHPAAGPRENGGEEWPQVGILALRVQPSDADVTIDGDMWEPSDETGPLILQLLTGVHAIEIRKEGYRTYSTEFSVRQGATATLNVALTPDR